MLVPRVAAVHLLVPPELASGVPLPQRQVPGPVR
jgi:hypothetical protein